MRVVLGVGEDFENVSKILVGNDLAQGPNWGKTTLN